MKYLILMLLLVLCGCAASVYETDDSYLREVEQNLQRLEDESRRIEADYKSRKSQRAVVTYEAYEDVYRLNTYERVKTQTGLPDGELVSELDVEGSKYETYVWRNPDRSMLMITFKDGRVETKYQSGLR